MMTIKNILEIKSYLEGIAGVIFDLDDTLYSEKDYVRSGYRAVAKLLDDDSLEERLWTYFENGKQAIDEVLSECGLTDRKIECLETYREQIPDITLYEGVVDLILELREKDMRVGIITDGRVSGQKKKIQALGLAELVNDIIITDELGGIQFRKPCDISFRMMQQRWGVPFGEMVYIGDNMKKDFQAPRQLGMKSIWFRNRDGLYIKR